MRARRRGDLLVGSFLQGGIPAGLLLLLSSLSHIHARSTITVTQSDIGNHSNAAIAIENIFKNHATRSSSISFKHRLCYTTLGTVRTIWMELTVYEIRIGEIDTAEGKWSFPRPSLPL